MRFVCGHEQISRSEMACSKRMGGDSRSTYVTSTYPAMDFHDCSSHFGRFGYLHSSAYASSSMGHTPARL